ncbi:MAG: hypothetical protein AAGL17_10240 [Cyanobacteria bacterium J06576_12]
MPAASLTTRSAQSEYSWLKTLRCFAWRAHRPARGPTDIYDFHPISSTGLMPLYVLYEVPRYFESVGWNVPV